MTVMGVILMSVIVTAMLVMHMRRIMVMRLVIARLVIMMCAIVVTVIMHDGTRDVGAAFGIERRFDLDDACAEALHHRLDDVIPADAKPFTDDLGRQMAIAEMPRDPHQMRRVAAANLYQRLGRAHHFDKPAVFQHQSIATAQCNGIFQVEQELQTARARHHHTAAMAVVEIQHHGIGRGLAEAMLSLNLRRADHVRTFNV